MMNKSNSVIYTGVTSDLVRRVGDHRLKERDGFTKRYNVTKLVYFEVFDDITDAIIREKQIKKSSRMKKISLIEKENPDKNDLYDEIATG